ncbi:putative secreted protein (Por secretion system target) [Neolewinella xylanilytica]|uniref:Putative secreted protein (Por secretion system target) n=1 Tax=Neolewinella xylanilytica TaxID=1514080 RepID=A0A2S6I9J6_9BACT|nr:T9SS type A sorting domain-containing protein [Neolewinella xylanilytica]PPK88158.1 putative secreted protein (Por secretion system target) [Neolewinella xylanilytica]
MYKPFTFCLLLCLSGYLSAQSYSFSVDTETYVDREDGRLLSGTSNWGSDYDLGFDIPLGFPFSFFGRSIDTLYFYERGLYTVPQPADDIFTGDLMVPNVADLADRSPAAEGDSRSPITYHLTGNAPARIGIIEWENVGYEDDIYRNNSSTEYTNFQVWLHEEDGTIEIHYGPSSAGVIAGLEETEPGVVMVKDYYENPATDSASWAELFYLKGDAASPRWEGIETIEALDTLDLLLNNHAVSGTVYRFTARETSPSGLFQPAANPAPLPVFPNPTTGRFAIDLAGDLRLGEGRLNVYDAAGRAVGDLAYPAADFDLSALPDGLYHLRLSTENGRPLVGRIVKR